METLRVAIVFILGMALPYLVQRWDRLRLSDEQREGAWNAASWGAALYAFGPWSMIGWWWVTRQRCALWRRESIVVLIGKSVLVLLSGLLAGVAIFAVIVGVYALMGGRVVE